MPEVSVKIRAEIMIPAAFPPDGGKDRNMIKKYEDACREAGLSEDRIKEIRNVFEVEKKRYERREKQKRQNNVWLVSVSELENEFKEFEWDIPRMILLI